MSTRSWNAGIDDRWRVPILLGIGHAVSEGLLAAPYQLLSRLLHATKRDEPQRHADPMLAAEIAADVGWDRLERGGEEEFGALRTELAKALAQLFKAARCQRPSACRWVSTWASWATCDRACATCRRRWWRLRVACS